MRYQYTPTKMTTDKKPWQCHAGKDVKKLEISYIAVDV